MKIAFLGTGRMGTELALHLLHNHDVTAWNRTASKTATVAEAGAAVAATPGEAVEGADVIVSSLFGPDTVREVVLDPNLIPEGVTWIDTTTVSPTDAREFADACATYVHAPVVGTLGPARQGSLGVYVGSPDASRRSVAAQITAPWAAANPDRLREVDTAATAATGKLLANLALAVSAQGLVEALHLGEAEGLGAEETLGMLEHTGLEFIKNMKAPFVTGERDTSPGDFTVDAIAKDARLMLATTDADLGAVAAALSSLEAEQDQGRGNHDFSSMAVHKQ